ncbi:MAG TPA: hypothetical protein DCX25_01535 [Candidatus Pacebacteria bacterium]|nr:MAG: hypothetical protein UX00_C0009G0024 [Microgenomates group bacterium GW2011_GWB1_45_17]KKU23274.1 MAG: hypothetical protein UX35_C0007G0012 [Microgenomates group bacterium GW2011_GWA1_46_15]KKU23443.1 MAG: hypothetical protein UX36_C0005G0024 [Microgenomates group bacterium GW2011_GWC1_46_15]HAV14987.1 hypothetical protein [Candidatus Paceibacterota bacterium]HCR11596.1 hypothetical protein [Candidatus Paceibacterota bacterium]
MQTTHIALKTCGNLLYELSKGSLLTAITTPIILPKTSWKQLVILYVVGVFCTILSIKTRKSYYSTIEERSVHVGK